MSTRVTPGHRRRARVSTKRKPNRRRSSSAGAASSPTAVHKNGSIQLIAEIRNARSLRGDLKFLLMTLVSYGHADGSSIYPSVPRLAGDLGWKTPRAVQLG